MLIGIISSIIGGLVITMVFTPHIRNSIKSKIFPKKYNPEQFEHLTDIGLLIDNIELLQNREFVRKYNRVYFPAVPTSRPNLIHLIFMHFAKELSKNGLKIHMFVFDHYYFKLGSRAKSIAKEDVNQFIRVLKGYGLNECNYKIIQESKYLRRAKRLRRTMNLMIEHSHDLKLGVFKKIQKDKWYIKDDAGFARFLKPIFNMLYLKQTSKRYGFTFSGEDEKPLWLSYSENVKTAREYKLCNLYIPILLGVGNTGTNVLDIENNVCYGDNKQKIFEKVKKDFAISPNIGNNTSIAMVLKILLFKENIKLSYRIGETQTFISSWDDLINSLEKVDESTKDLVYSSIAQFLYEKINNKMRKK